MSQEESQWNVFCDFDGTVSRVDVTDSLLEAFALPAWRDLEEEWKAGRIGSLECMQRQVELMRCDRRTLDAHLAQIDIDPAFPAFVAYCEERQLPLQIVSDGMDYVIKFILRRHRLGHLPVYANRLESRGSDQYTLTFPYAHKKCPMAAGTCKCHLMEMNWQDGYPALMIGDGASDFCAAQKADMVFAKAKLCDFCRNQGIQYQKFDDFREVLQLIKALPMPQERFTCHA